ncbi:MAG: class I SAM-dependent methyltransferase [Dehalococcoidia bacterium]|nr:class I SAM-dependent methyltransferase [Dehalococcoidia bacterium]
MSRSISFDRAAEFYDRTRALKPEVQESVTGALAAELQRLDARWLLEVGAGTGRITYPLTQRGVRVTAIDISLPMLLRFREKPGAADGVDFLLGDATRLPFRTGSFRAALTVHVLHLIPDWQRAIQELQRVLAPGGVVMRLGDIDDFERLAEHRDSDTAWNGILARRGYVPRVRAGIQDTNAYVREIGGSVRTLEVAHDFDLRSERDWIGELRRRIHSNLWEVPDEIYWPAVDEYEAWARQRFPALDEPRRVNRIYILDVWTWG